MELAKNYNPSEVEGKWYQYWIDHKLFASKPDGRQPYTIVIPPPNVTGVLHMGHMLNNTIQDILIRKARIDEARALHPKSLCGDGPTLHRFVSNTFILM